MISRIAFASVVVLSAALLVSAQTDSAGSQAATESPISYSEALMPPMPVTGVRAPLRLSSETPRSNLLTGSITFSTAYDDNILGSAEHRVGDVSYLFFPTLDFAQTRERWNIDFGYSPGFTINQKLNERNQSAHDLHLVFGYRLSPHVSLQMRDSFNKSTTLFSSAMPSSTQQPTPIQGPNTSLIIPFANTTGNTSGLDLTYQFGRDSLVGVSGGYYFTNYENPGGSGQTYGFVDTRSWNGDAFYVHRFGGRHWIGLAYNYQRLLFDPGYRTDVQRVLLSYSVSLGSNMTLSLWGGPERSLNLVPTLMLGSTPALLPQKSWYGAGGLMLSWQGTRTGFSLGYSQQTSDGGGLAQAVRMQQGSAEVRRRLTQRWTTSVGAQYGRNNPLTVSAIQPLKTWSGNAGFDYQITDHLGFSLRYGRDQQRRLAGPDAGVNRNRGWISISYSFTRPLGR